MRSGGIGSSAPYAMWMAGGGGAWSGGLIEGSRSGCERACGRACAAFWPVPYVCGFLVLTPARHAGALSPRAGLLSVHSGPTCSSASPAARLAAVLGSSPSSVHSPRTRVAARRTAILFVGLGRSAASVGASALRPRPISAALARAPWFRAAADLFFPSRRFRGSAGSRRRRPVVGVTDRGISGRSPSPIGRLRRAPAPVSGVTYRVAPHESRHSPSSGHRLGESEPRLRRDRCRSPPTRRSTGRDSPPPASPAAAWCRSRRCCSCLYGLSSEARALSLVLIPRTDRGGVSFLLICGIDRRLRSAPPRLRREGRGALPDGRRSRLAAALTLPLVACPSEGASAFLTISRRSSGGCSRSYGRRCWRFVLGVTLIRRAARAASSAAFAGAAGPRPLSPTAKPADRRVNGRVSRRSTARARRAAVTSPTRQLTIARSTRRRAQTVPAGAGRGRRNAA
jgi:hypothetical protein